MIHLVSHLEFLTQRDLIRPGRDFFEVDRSVMLPTPLYYKGLQLVALEEIYVGDPVILRERGNHRIVAYWDTFPSLTELFELALILS